MIVGDGRLDANRQQLSLAELNAIAIPDWREQSVHIPVHPFPHRLPRRRIGPFEAPERLGQMLDYGRGLDINALTVEENRHLPPARQRPELRRLVHPLLEADVAERERLAR